MGSPAFSSLILMCRSLRLAVSTLLLLHHLEAGVCHAAMKHVWKLVEVSSNVGRHGHDVGTDEDVFYS